MSVLTILAGILILVQGALDVAGITLVPAPDIVRPYMTAVGAVSVVAGVIVVLAGWLISHEKRALGSRVAILFSVVGFAGGGGFILGTILGLIGGFSNFRAQD